MSIELVHVYRGKYIENIHRGDIVIVDKNLKVLTEYGDKEKNTFIRSSAKPIQAIPFIRNNGHEKYKLSGEEIALMCSSHGGEEKHVSVLKQMVKKIGLELSDVQCGESEPMNNEEKIRMIKNKIAFTVLNNPCSGKHLMMIGYSKLLGIDYKGYYDIKHRVQQDMVDVIAEFSELNKDSIGIAVDGCGVPVFRLPILNMAIMYSKLGDSDSSTRIITKAMTENSYYVAGTGRLDTIIMEETKGRILAKLGADAVYCMTDLEKQHGIALKVESGNIKVLDILVPKLLRKHDYINSIEEEAIMNRLHLNILNKRKEVIGHYEVTI